MKPKILFLSNIPSPYRVNFFNELGKISELTVIFDQAFYQHREEAWKNYKFETFEGIILNKKSGKPGKFCPSVIKYLKRKKYDAIFVTNLALPTGIFAIEYMKMLRIPYILEIDGGKAGTSKDLKKFIKKVIYRGADWYFSTSEVADGYYTFYGIDNEKIVRYPFTSLYTKDILDKPLTTTEKMELKATLGLTGEKYVVTVGRFIYGKGYDILLRADKYFVEGAKLLIIGGEPTEEYKKIIEENNLTNVEFLPFMDSETLGKYYSCCDVFVFPTRTDSWGLVLGEAMAKGLPVVSSKGAVSALTLIKEGENGYMYEIDDEKSMAKYVNEILNNKDLADKMAENNIRKMQEYTYENMAKVHVDSIIDRM